jgi:hypothetical protein
MSLQAMVRKRVRSDRTSEEAGVLTGMLETDYGTQSKIETKSDEQGE